MKRNPKLGDLVVMNNDQHDATFFRVVDIAGREIGLVDAEVKGKDLLDQRVQWADKSVIFYPNLIQSYNFIDRMKEKIKFNDSVKRVNCD